MHVILPPSRFTHKAEDQYRHDLQQQGHEVVRFAIFPGQELKPLLCDLFDKTTWELIEAKSTAARDAIRYGLGQLLDYRRFIQPIPTMALLVPSQPRDDLRALLAEHSIRVIWEDPYGQFHHADT